MEGSSSYRRWQAHLPGCLRSLRHSATCKCVGSISRSTNWRRGAPSLGTLVTRRRRPPGRHGLAEQLTYGVARELSRLAGSRLLGCVGAGRTGAAGDGLGVVWGERVVL